MVSTARGGAEVGDSGGQKESVPAMFVFGDSLIDNGNNNGLASFAKANYYPYGIDFAGGPTGRFSNGYNIVDEIGEHNTSLRAMVSDMHVCHTMASTCRCS